MSESRVTVARYADLEDDPDLSAREADAVARALRNGVPVVAVVEPWLANDKDLSGLDNHERIFVGTVRRESEKAWFVAQNTGDQLRKDWLPKSVTTLYDRTDDADLTSPQATLGGEIDA